MNSIKMKGQTHLFNLVSTKVNPYGMCLIQIVNELD
jgi:hypothetical protein